ncbi:MAG: UPF0182 family protein [Candidatus Methylomirabilales bacterium]
MRGNRRTRDIFRWANPPRTVQKSGHRWSRLLPALVLVALLLVASQSIPLYTEWLWFDTVGFSAVFLTIFLTRSILTLIFGAICFSILYLNLFLVYRSPATDVLVELEDHLGLPSRFILEPYIKRFLLPVTALVSLLAALQVTGQWEAVLRFLHPSPFQIQDPLFHKGLSFYIFRLPFLNFVYQWLMTILVLTTLLVVIAYILYRGIQITGQGLRFSPRARTHLLLLIGALLFLKAWGYHLSTYDLLYSSRGVVFGASYTDVFATLPALRILTVFSAVCGFLALTQIWRQRLTPLFAGLAILVGAAVIGQIVYPNLLQRFRVVPNELDLESPYIIHNIRYTRAAYGLDRIEEVEFPAEENLSMADLRRNELTVNNIRLWDPRPLLATFAQLQEIRTYYKFVDVDVDRYPLNGNYEQVMLSPRELSSDHLPSRIWINEHLTFTHGYGMVLGPVNRVSPEGLPVLYIKNIPPVSGVSLTITRPEIYYGELGNEYVFVNTRSKELDYPAGDKNVYSTYQGNGGIPITGFLRKALFAARFGTIRILFSQDVVPGSRLMFYRRIGERVNKVAPFLRYEPDPYLVIAEDGKLFWILDAYTTSDRYPYSDPHGQAGNYIRNSVKVVVDAYNGSMRFYISDPDDPLIQTYAKIFPTLFRPLEAMPADLKSHIRYPETLFAIQAEMYATYHMRSPQVFYNKEDVWNIPRRAAEKDVPMKPYYIIMKLPGENREEFILLIPFTPARKDNMSAWMAARSDSPHYGKLIVYNMPKQKLVFGPRQIEARLNQDAFISQQLSLWGQRGSQVIHGPLLAIPIETSLLYVQPLYLAAEERSLPELKRVIVAYGNQIAMEETLDQALTRIFGGTRLPSPPVPARLPTARLPASIRDLANKALAQFQKAQRLLRQGNFAAYEEEQKRLEQTLQRLRDKAAGAP